VFFVSLADIGRETNDRKVSKLLLLPSNLLLGLDCIATPMFAMFSIDPSECGTIGLRALLALQEAE